MHLTWRDWVVCCPASEGTNLAVVPAREAEDLPGSGEYGLEQAEAAA